MGFDRAVALAAAFPQSFHVQDANIAPPVLDQPCLLQRPGDNRNARPPDADHLSKKLLRERQFVAIREVAHPHQPAAHPSFHRMTGVAGRRLLRLRKQYLLVTDNDRAKSRVIVGNGAEAVGVDQRTQRPRAARSLCSETLCRRVPMPRSGRHPSRPSPFRSYRRHSLRRPREMTPERKK